MTPALDAALPLLRCPVCGEGLDRDAANLRCANGHTFDIARQGYVTLLAGRRPHRGDTAEMIGARDRFLAAGHYATIADTVARAVATAAPEGPLLDLAAGTGWYAAHVLDGAGHRNAVATDVSVPALRRAARMHQRLAAVGADAWSELPLAGGAFAAVLSIFGPRHATEVGRVLAPQGVVVAVTPTPRHLGEVVGPLGMLGVGDDKPVRLREAFAAFELVSTERVDYELRLGHAGLTDLAGMGPAGHHHDAGTFATRVTELPDTVPVTVSVDVTTFRRP